MELLRFCITDAVSCRRQTFFGLRCAVLKSLAAPNLLLLWHLPSQWLLQDPIFFSEHHTPHYIFSSLLIWLFINIYYSILSNSKIRVTIFAMSLWYYLYFGFGSRQRKSLASFQNVAFFFFNSRITRLPRSDHIKQIKKVCLGRWMFHSLRTTFSSNLCNSVLLLCAMLPTHLVNWLMDLHPD